jgi:hypothetical protein
MVLELTEYNIRAAVLAMLLNIQGSHTYLHFGVTIHMSLYVTFTTLFKLYSAALLCVCAELYGPHGRSDKSVQPLPSSSFIGLQFIIHEIQNLKADFCIHDAELYGTEGITY